MEMKFTLTVIAVLLSGLLIHVTDTTVIIAFRVLINLPPGRPPQPATILVADKLKTQLNIDDLSEIAKKHIHDPTRYYQELDNHIIHQEERADSKVIRVKNIVLAFAGDAYAQSKILANKLTLQGQSDPLAYLETLLYSRTRNQPIDAEIIVVQPGLDYLTVMRCMSIDDCSKSDKSYPYVHGFGDEFVKEWLNTHIPDGPISLNDLKWKLKEVFSALRIFQQQSGVFFSSQNHAGYVITRDGPVAEIDENNMPLNYNDIMNKRKERNHRLSLDIAARRPQGSLPSPKSKGSPTPAKSAVPLRPSNPWEPQPSTSRGYPPTTVPVRPTGYPSVSFPSTFRSYPGRIGSAVPVASLWDSQPVMPRGYPSRTGPPECMRPRRPMEAAESKKAKKHRSWSPSENEVIKQNRRLPVVSKQSLWSWPSAA